MTSKGAAWARPSFLFLADSSEPGELSGVATWRFHKNDDAVVVVQRFANFHEAIAINDVIDAAWVAGEAAGYLACENKVLEALSS